jgi:uncharacterized membrane protein
MTLSFNALKTTLIGGVVFLLPLVVVLVVLGQAMALVAQLAAPLAAHFPQSDIGGVAVATLVALVLVLSLCYGAGRLARAAFARALSERFENRLHAVYPRYTVIKAMTQGLGAQGGTADMKTVLVTFDDHELLAMEVERLGDGRVVLFLPGAPDPWSGNVVLVQPQRVQPLGADIAALNRSLKRLGRGSASMLRDAGRAA